MKNGIVFLFFLLTQSVQAQKMVLFVADKKVSHAGTGVECLQVKEKPGEPYALLYSSIQGFSYQEGYRYELNVIRIPLKETRADAPGYKYYLINVVKKEKASMDADRLSIPDQVIMPLLKINRNGKLEPVSNDPIPDVYFDLKKNKLSGNNGCNHYFAKMSAVNGNIRISTLGSTDMACLNNPIDVPFMQLLQQINRYVWKGNTFLLLRNKEVLLQFAVPPR